MIFKRHAANFRAQHWSALLLELGIVILGVFIGTWVANWNQERAAKAETRRMVEQLGPSLRQLGAFFVATRDYHAVTRAYADTAIAGWRRDRQVSDADFVIASYQASQIDSIGTNGSTFSSILGADRLRDIADPALRTDLSVLMSADYSQINQSAVDTPYRRNVRRIIPIEIQDRIRKQCGDQPRPSDPGNVILPGQCRIELSPAEAAKAAAILRARPEVMEDLQWHIAAVAAYLNYTIAFEEVIKRVESRGVTGLE